MPGEPGALRGMSTLEGQRLSPKLEAGRGGQQPDGGTRDHRGFHTAAHTAPGNRHNCVHFLCQAEAGLPEDTREAENETNNAHPFFLMFFSIMVYQRTLNIAICATR